MGEQDAMTPGEVGRTLKRIEENIKELRSDVSAHFVTQKEFVPVQRIAYGFVAITLIAVIGSLLKFALR